MTVDAAFEFFEGDESLSRSLGVLCEVGLGYIRLDQSETELSGGKAQRVKLATELQRVQRGGTLYVLDEPTTGSHPSDVEKLTRQLQGLVDAGNTDMLVEHDMSIAAETDWIVDVGPGAGDEGAAGPPKQVAGPGQRDLRLTRLGTWTAAARCRLVSNGALHG
jgi:excinuclease ABC subunit A